MKNQNDLHSDFLSPKVIENPKDRSTLIQEMKNLEAEIETVIENGIDSWMGVVRFIDPELFDKFMRIKYSKLNC